MADSSSALPQAILAKFRAIQQTTRWRTLAVVAILSVLALNGFLRQDIVLGPTIARLTVEGFIDNDQKRLQSLHSLREGHHNVQALIVYINSPGGTMVGGEALYKALRQVNETIPVVAVMGELGTSAAYMTALGARHVLAHEGTITGSIGVIMQTFNIIPLLQNLGILPETFKSGPLKAAPNPFETTTEPVRESARQMIADSKALFFQLVQERRQLSTDTISHMRDGRVVLGRQAARMNLIDALGGEKEALRWLNENHDIAEDTPIIDLVYKEKPPIASLFMRAALHWLTPEQASGGTRHPQALLLSQQQGLLSLWLAP